jgi:ketosteroid isomerase-like protein
MSDSENNKRLLRHQRESSQRGGLPSALPGAAQFERQTPLSGFTPTSLMVSVDPPGRSGNVEAYARGFPSQAMGPTFISYGPMVAEGDVVFEEWESFIFGNDGTLYNNQYCWYLRFENDAVVAMREYNDSHHAAITFGPLGGWPDVEPSTSPRRRDRTAKETLPDSELETVFEVIDEFELDPRLLCDVVPSASHPPVPAGSGIEANKALVRGLRHARKAGDPAVVGRFFAEGFRHFMAGERPFGWDHQPIEEIYAPLVEHLASPLTVRYGPLVADGDIVVEEMDSFAHEVRDGKIVQTREYLDTRHMWVVLGRWAPWAATPVPPRSRPRRSNLQMICSTTQTPTMFLDLGRWQPFGASPS